MMEDKEEGNAGAMAAAIRSAKKTIRPVKIGEIQPKTKATKGKKRKGPRASAAGFDRDMGSAKSREGARARKTDAVGGMGKKTKHKPRKTSR
jgi:ATP-dependent RNA helicase DDX27